MMTYSQHRRRGVTLLELLVVVVFMGLLASIVTMRFGPDVLGNMSTNTDARRISLMLLQAQRAAIRSGDNHFVEFTLNGDGEIQSYQLRRRTDTDVEDAGTAVEISREVSGSVSHSQMEFTFEGEALGAYGVTLEGANRTWRLEVTPINGAIRSWET